MTWAPGERESPRLQLEHPTGHPSYLFDYGPRTEYVSWKRDYACHSFPEIIGIKVEGLFPPSNPWHLLTDVLSPLGR